MHVFGLINTILYSFIRNCANGLDIHRSRAQLFFTCGSPINSIDLSVISAHFVSGVRGVHQLRSQRAPSVHPQCRRTQEGYTHYQPHRHPVARVANRTEGQGEKLN